MNRKFNRVIVVGMLLLAVPLLSVVAGGTQGARAPEGPVTITVWKGSWWADQAPVVERAFAESHTNRVRIETYPFDGLIEKYVIAIAGGQAPDIIAADNNMMPLLISRGLLQPLSGVDRSDFSGAIWEASSADGLLYGIPFRADTSGVFSSNDLDRFVLLQTGVRDQLGQSDGRVGTHEYSSSTCLYALSEEPDRGDDYGVG
jgi:multiple sugar transport system substrate-binding protein